MMPAIRFDAVRILSDTGTAILVKFIYFKSAPTLWVARSMLRSEPGPVGSYGFLDAEQWFLNELQRRALMARQETEADEAR